jgi:radical SAM protein with 4Fe4S-binding SPASM domain
MQASAAAPGASTTPPGDPTTAPNPLAAPLPAGYRQQRSAAVLVEQRAAAAKAPFSAMVEIADRCNEACVHCYQVQGEKGELETAEWERIFRELAELGVLFLTISGGEATLRKDFLHLVAYARKLRFAVKIFSNGLRITPELAAELGRLAVQEVQLSLYSQRAEAHDAVTRVPGSFDRLVAAVRDLRSAGVRVVLKSPVMASNAAEYERYVEFVTSLGAEYSLDPKLNPREDGDMAPTELGIDKRTYLRLRRDLRFVNAQRAPRSRPLDSTPCAACSGNVHIEPNGELRPCTQWSVPTGHALNTSLREAWYEDAAARSIRQMTWNDLPGCRGCDLRAFCQRCYGEAEKYTGDALAPYARACQSARWKYEAERGVEPEIDCLEGRCAAPPLGPFRQAGEHRFLVERVDAVATPASPHRPWLGAAAAAPGAATSLGLVQLRRRDTGRALTPNHGSPSERQG